MSREKTKGGSTTNRQSIPPRLKAEIDKYYKATYKQLKTLEAKRNIPPTITKHILADLRSLVYNEYKGLNITPAELVRLGASPYDIDQDIDNIGRHGNPPLQSLWRRYSAFATAIRLKKAADNAPEQEKGHIYERLRRKLVGSVASIGVEIKRYYKLPPTDEEILTAATINYTEFVVLAAMLWGATERELEAIPLPQVITRLLNEEQLFRVKEDLFSSLLDVAEFPIESIDEHDARIDERERQRRKESRAAARKVLEERRQRPIVDDDRVEPGDPMNVPERPAIKKIRPIDNGIPGPKATHHKVKAAATTDAPQDSVIVKHPADVEDQVDDQIEDTKATDVVDQAVNATASTITKKIITLYQTNTATLAKPLEAITDATAIVGLGRKPQPLGAIIAAMAVKQQISPTRVTQCLEGLQLLAQRKENGLISIDGNDYYIYNDLSLKEAVRLLTGLENPNGEELRETAQALSLITNLRIGHDENHIVGYDQDKRPIVKRYRHFTQMANIPDIKALLDDEGLVKGEVYLTFQIHRLIKTGRRTDKPIIDQESGQKQRIAQPVGHLVVVDELEESRKLFRGDNGVRFYNTLLSQGHIKEADLVARVFDYDGQIAAAMQQAKGIASKADEQARKASTIEEAEAIRAAAREEGNALVKTAKRNIGRNRKRDTERLYAWLDTAVNAFMIKPYDKTKAKDGSGDYVITWQRFEAD